MKCFYALHFLINCTNLNFMIYPTLHRLRILVFLFLFTSFHSVFCISSFLDFSEQLHVTVNNIPIQLSEGQYNYIFGIPSYTMETPILSVSTSSSDILISPIEYSEQWPGSATFIVTQGENEYSYNIEFALQPYHRYFFEDTFDYLPGPFNPTHTASWTGSLASSWVTEKGIKLINCGGALGFEVIASTGINFYISKKSGFDDIIIGIPLLLDCDVLALKSENEISFYTNSKDKLTFSGCGNQSEKTYTTITASFPTLQSQLANIKITAPKNQRHVLDNIRIYQNPPAITTLTDHIEFYNHQMLDIKSNGIYLATQQTNNIQSLTFELNDTVNAQLYTNERSLPTITGFAKANIEMKPNQWYFLSFPFDVDRILLNDQTALCEHDLRIKYYDSDSRAHNGNGENFTFLENTVSGKPFPLLKANKGYIIAIHGVNHPEGAILTFKASSETAKDLLNNKDFTTTLSYQADADLCDRGINLLGHSYSANYYPSPNEIFLTYDGVNYRYDHPNGIPPFKAFFMQGASDSYTFHVANRRNPQSSYQSKELNTESHERLQLKVEADGLSDFTDIRINNKASDRYDIGLDYSKLWSLRTDVPHIYSTKWGNACCIHTIGNIAGETRIPITIKSGKGGIHQVSLNKSDLKQIDVHLQHGNEIIDLKRNIFSTHINSNEILDCDLILTPSANNIDSSIPEYIDYVINDESVSVYAPSTSLLNITDISGRNLYSTRLHPNEWHEIPQYIKGYIIINISNENENRTIKLKI